MFTLIFGITLGAVVTAYVLGDDSNNNNNGGGSC